MNLAERLLRLVLPQVCARCRHPLPGEAFICAPCLTRLSEEIHHQVFKLEIAGTPILFACKSTAPYSGGIDETIRRLKFSGKTIYAKGLGFMMATVSETFPVRFDAVSFVPLTKARRKERGFNQAQLLAAEIAEFLQLPLLDLLIKTEDTAPQHTRTAKERQTNLKGKFRATDECAGKRILLADDVMTTGNTLCVCAEALYRQHALQVVGISAAHSVKGS